MSNSFSRHLVLIQHWTQLILWVICWQLPFLELVDSAVGNFSVSYGLSILILYVTVGLCWALIIRCKGVSLWLVYKLLLGRLWYSRVLLSYNYCVLWPANWSMFSLHYTKYKEPTHHSPESIYQIHIILHLTNVHVRQLNIYLLTKYSQNVVAIYWTLETIIFKCIVRLNHTLFDLSCDLVW